MHVYLPTLPFIGGLNTTRRFTDCMSVGYKAVPIFLVWDFSYPLLPWLVKPFAMSTSLTVQQKTFNYRIRKYGSTFYIGIAMVILPYFGPMGKLKYQFSPSVSTQFDFYQHQSGEHVES